MTTKANPKTPKTTREPSKPRQVGRPTLYRPEYCKRFIEMSAEGKLVVEIAAEIGVARQSLLDWKAEHPEFSVAYTRGRELCEAWHARQGMQRLYSGESWGQAAAWTKVMASMFKGDWVSTDHHTHGADASLTSFLAEVTKAQRPFADGDA